jgi:hypothetical protein
VPSKGKEVEVPGLQVFQIEQFGEVFHLLSQADLEYWRRCVGEPDSVRQVWASAVEGRICSFWPLYHYDGEWIQERVQEKRS